MESLSHYQDIQNRFQAQAAKEQKIFSQLGNGKLLVFVALIAATFLLIRNSTTTNWLLSGLLFVLLIVLAVYQSAFKRRLHYSKAMVNISGQYLQRIEGNWREFADTGTEFAINDHPYADDLDVIGPASLWQLICIAKSWHGRRQLAQDLLEPAYTMTEIADRQQAVAELHQKRLFACQLEYSTAQIGPAVELPKIIASLADGQAYLPNQAARLFVRLMPLLTIALLVVASLLRIQALYLPLFFLASFQLLVWLAAMPKTSPYLATVNLAPLIFGHYATALNTVAQEKFTDKHLQAIQNDLQEAIGAIHELDLIVNRISVKNFGIFYYLLNIMLFWDFDCAIKLSNWKARYGKRCEFWLLQLGELESLLSLSVLGNTCNTACLPEVDPTIRGVKARLLGHPLLSNKTRVCNDFEQQEQLLLVSGSNMSGKTTFLRTVGLNLLLARTGGYACAESLACGSFQLISSMRVRDDLSEGYSSFYAELRRIARIVAAAKTEGDLFFLIDEIFRGTNSEDRLAGATAVIQELSHQQALGLVTTHDLSLCDLAKSLNNLCNYSFAEHYQGEQMLFDYRLRRGKSTSTNAQFLMRQVGIKPQKIK